MRKDVSDFNVIRDVSKTLETVLTNGLSELTPTPPPIAVVHDLQGTISTSPAQLTLFLFEVLEDPSARNRPHMREPSVTEVIHRRPPVALILRYLVTPWSGDRLTDHIILGRTIQVLYDGAIISGPQLEGDLANYNEALKVTMMPLTLEDRTRVWQAVQKPYRTSITYEVRVVNIESDQARKQPPVKNRTLRPAKPEEMS